MNKYEQAALGAIVLMLLAAGAIFLYAPTDALQGVVQRIFYLHVSAAIAAYGCFAVVLVGGIIYLRTENLTADRFARAGALVGLLFTTVTLVMGMLWAKPIWGAFWTWDARLTSTLVLWIIYAGYLLVRRLAEPGRQAARIAAVVGMVANAAPRARDHQRRPATGDARDIPLHDDLHTDPRRGHGCNPIPDRDPDGRCRREGRLAGGDSHRPRRCVGCGADQVIYLVIAYTFAVVLLGGYLVWSLNRLRGLEKKSER
jgi:hypothetical protein